MAYSVGFQDLTIDTGARSRAPKVIMRGAAIGLSIIAAIVVVVVLGVRSLDDLRLPELSSRGMALLGEEEFDGGEGSPPDPQRFDFDVGGTGWGNHEQQFYTRDAKNVRLSGRGQLIIQARRQGSSFTSARVVTRGKLNVTYGLVEARIKMPAGKGIHPAFWLVGSDIASVGWPACGEIDVIEVVNSGDEFHNAIHGPTIDNPTIQWKQSHDGPAPDDLTADFHTYQVLRQPGLIKIGIDGKLLGEYRSDALPPDARWIFDRPMYITLNVAVGGVWPGPVAESTPFPATMLVDWIKYWQ